MEEKGGVEKKSNGVTSRRRENRQADKKGKDERRKIGKGVRYTRRVMICERILGKDFQKDAYWAKV